MRLSWCIHVSIHVICDVKGAPKYHKYQGPVVRRVQNAISSSNDCGHYVNSFLHRSFLQIVDTSMIFEWLSKQNFLFFLYFILWTSPENMQMTTSEKWFKSVNAMFNISVNIARTTIELFLFVIFLYKEDFPKYECRDLGAI